MIVNEAVPTARLTQALETGAEHMRPVILAVRDYGCAYGIVAQDVGPFGIPTDRPSVVLIGDDFHDARGPAAFHKPSMKRLIRRASAAVIVSSGATLPPYAAAATVAAIKREHAVIIETRPEQEIPWMEFVWKYRPDIRMLVSTVKGGTA